MTTYEAKLLRIPITGQPDIEMIRIEPGYFLMGSDDPVAYDNEKNVHLVQIKNPYYLSKTPITQAQWAAVMQGDNPDPSNFKGRNRPVEQVSWLDIMEGGQVIGNKASFISLLDAAHINGFVFTLPTEAQWEYAAKGGHFTALKDEQIELLQKKLKKTADLNALYSGCDRIKELGWHGGSGYTIEAIILALENTLVSNSLKQTQPVGFKPPNALGLYDMTGNVFEWCLDHYKDRYLTENQDERPFITEDLGAYRVLRGGSWFSSLLYCHVSRRDGFGPGFRRSDLGFRLALSLQV